MCALQMGALPITNYQLTRTTPPFNSSAYSSASSVWCDIPSASRTKACIRVASPATRKSHPGCKRAVVVRTKMAFDIAIACASAPCVSRCAARYWSNTSRIWRRMIGTLCDVSASASMRRWFVPNMFPMQALTLSMSAGANVTIPPDLCRLQCSKTRVVSSRNWSVPTWSHPRCVVIVCTDIGLLASLPI